MKRLAVLASGRGSNLRAIHAATQPGGVLDAIANIAVVASDKPGSGALAFAAEVGLPTIALPKDGRPREVWDAALVAALDPFAIDFVALAGFMRVLSSVFLSRYEGRVVNVHPADTRVHRGLGGYEFAFDRRLTETTVTVHLVDAGLDTGPILAQRTVDLRGVTTLEEIEQRGLAVEHAVYSDTLRELLLSAGGEARE